jgi:hypothetical protein
VFLWQTNFFHFDGCISLSGGNGAVALSDLGDTDVPTRVFRLSIVDDETPLTMRGPGTQWTTDFGPLDLKAVMSFDTAVYGYIFRCPKFHM